MNHEQRLKDEHIKLIERIYHLCRNIDLLLKIITYGTLLGILFGGLIAFNIFLLLYSKGMIQQWFF